MGKVQEHNREIMAQAKYRASQMQTWPSKLEERMIGFLDSNHIEYEFQKIFYIYDKNGWIVKYYIADFYLPKSHIIIEVDGKFHDKHKMHDKVRTRLIEGQYPGTSTLRYRWADLSDTDKMKELLRKIHIA